VDAAAVERSADLYSGEVERPPPEASGWNEASRRRVVAGCKKATRMREIGNTGEGRRVDDEASTSGLFGVRWTRGSCTSVRRDGAVDRAVRLHCGGTK